MSDTRLPDRPDRPERPELQRSSRDPDRLRRSLEGWLTSRLGAHAKPQVTDLSATSDNGMSSDTVLFDAAWIGDGGEARSERLVARIAPADDDVPVFPSYDLKGQFDVMTLVADQTDVPVPKLWWYEPDGSVLGSPFLMMSRVEGVVPPDVMPYTFGDNWLFDASPADQRRLQDATVGVLAQLHSMPIDARPDALRTHVDHTRTWYEFAAADVGRSALVEQGFAWLDTHWPSAVGPTVLSWGDARIGNVLYRDFTPVAVLDWEMHGTGPPELDIAWLVTAHKVFHDLATAFDLPGMPGFLRADDVCSTYESMTGYAPRDLDFFATYAAVQWGIVFLRTGWRQVHFGERTAPADPDELLHHRATFERLLAVP